MKYRLVNIGRGDFVIDKNTYEVVRDFNDAPLKGTFRNPKNDVAITENQLVIPGSARELYFGADEQTKKDVVSASGFYQSELLSEKNPEYEQWFKSFTVEGANGADPYDNENHYNYAKYYEDVVRDNIEVENERNQVNEPISSEYMTSTHPFYNEFFPLAANPVNQQKNTKAIDGNIDASNINIPLP